MAPLGRLLTRPEISTNRTTNKKQNSTKTGGVAHGGNTRTRGKNTAGKPPNPSERQANSEEWIFNVYVIFKRIVLPFPLSPRPQLMR